jgi:hypothetical protein
MKADHLAEKRRWAWAGGAGMAMAALVMALFRAPLAPPAAASAPPPTLGLIRLGRGSADTLLKEQTELHDQAALFLPTELNSRPPTAERGPGVAFASYPAKLEFPTDRLQVALPNDMPPRRVDALESDPPGNPLLGIGRTDEPVTELPARGGFVEIVAAGTGAPVLSAPLPGAHPPDGAAWQPLEFIAAVDAAGLVGPLVLTLRSDEDAVDSYFKRYLTETFRVGDRLPPGFYRIRVGP